MGALCLLHCLKGPQDQEQVDPVVLQAFDTSQNAFLSLDAKKDGFISKADLRAAMHEKGTSQVHLVQGVDTSKAETWVNKRFQELDSATGHKDNRCSYLEFVFTLNEWALPDDEDDEDGQA